MSTQRYISTSFWSDKWIRSINPSDRYLYMYLLTNPQTNIAGVYQITIDRIAFDTGYDERTLIPMLEKFAEAGKAYLFMDEWIILPSWPKHQKWQEKPTIKKGIDGILKSVPDSVKRYMVSIGYQYPIIGYEYQPSYSDSDSDSDSDLLDQQKPKQPKQPKKATIPAIQDVEQYAKEKCQSVNPKSFFDYYSEGEWKDGNGKPVKNWKLKMQTWHSRNIERGWTPPQPEKKETLNTCEHCGTEYTDFCRNPACPGYL